MNIELKEDQIEGLKSQIITKYANELNRTSLIKKLGENSSEELFKIILEVLNLHNNKPKTNSDYIQDFLIETQQHFKDVNDLRKLNLFMSNNLQDLSHSCKNMIGKKIDIVKETTSHCWNNKIETELIFDAEYHGNEPFSYRFINIFIKLKEEGIDYSKYCKETQKKMKTLLEGKIITNCYPCIYHNFYCQCIEIDSNKYYAVRYSPEYINEDGYIIEDYDDDLD